jgi:hypothetical protein
MSSTALAPAVILELLAEINNFNQIVPPPIPVVTADDENIVGEATEWEKKAFSLMLRLATDTRNLQNELAITISDDAPALEEKLSTLLGKVEMLAAIAWYSARMRLYTDGVRTDISIRADYKFVKDSVSVKMAKSRAVVKDLIEMIR